jgi:hypothetical protein
MMPVTSTSEPRAVDSSRAAPPRLVTGVADVGHPLPVDHERGAAHPDPLVRVVLRVDRVDAARSDDEVVDVGAVVADRDGVQRAPGVRQLLQTGGDEPFPLRADAPRSLVGVHP